MTIIAKPPLVGVDGSALRVRPKRLVRSDAHAAFPLLPTNSPPEISGDGERITFRVCVNPHGIAAGSYSGSIAVDGPSGVRGTSLDIAVTARSPGWFGVGLIVALIVALVGLELKSVSDYQRDIKGRKTPRGHPITFKAKDALLYIWRLDEIRIVSTLVGLAATLVSVLILYNKDRTWGADVLLSILATAQAALTATGVQGIIDGFRGSVKESIGA